MKKLVLFTFVCITSFLSICVKSAPWVDAQDVYLRADIQTLADAGIITVPINTYPLMWSGIGADLYHAELSEMSQDVQSAYLRVNFYYNQAVNNEANTRVKASAASDPARFQHFGSDYREKGELRISNEYVGSRFSYKVSVTGALDAQDDKSLRVDDSYLAGVIGNWVISAGTISQWWGPGMDTGLMRSTNARPMPSLWVSRNDSHGFQTPWLSWIGPWTLSAGVSWENDDRAVEDTLLWNFRSSIRPLKQLEIGVSWTTQLCGKGQPCGLSTFFDAVSGSTECSDGSNNCDSALNTKIGNQMAGFDIRYNDKWFDIPVGIYAERTCEDSSGPSPFDIADCAMLYGADSRFSYKQQSYKVFLEYSDTLRACGEDKNAFNCFYEHSTYLSGSRYYRRSLGSTYDSDAKVWVLGLIGQYQNSRGLQAYLRYARLNDDGSFVHLEWTPYIPKEKLLMLELSYRWPIMNGMMTIGGSASRSDYPATDSDSDGTVFASYEYRY